MAAFIAWLSQTWLGRQIEKYLWNEFLLLVASVIATLKKSSKEKKNETIKNEVENAKTPEEKQTAVDDVASRWGK